MKPEIKIGQRWIYTAENKGIFRSYNSPHIFTITDIGEHKIGTGGTITVKPYLSDIIQNRAASTILKEFELLSNQNVIQECNAGNIFNNLKEDIKEKILKEYLERKQTNDSKSK